MCRSPARASRWRRRDGRWGKGGGGGEGRHQSVREDARRLRCQPPTPSTAYVVGRWRRGTPSCVGPLGRCRAPSCVAGRWRQGGCRRRYLAAAPRHLCRVSQSLARHCRTHPSLCQREQWLDEGQGVWKVTSEDVFFATICGQGSKTVDGRQRAGGGAGSHACARHHHTELEPALPSSHAQAPDAYILAWGVEVAAAPAPAPTKVAL
jgi:hypothetical protein